MPIVNITVHLFVLQISCNIVYFMCLIF